MGLPPPLLLWLLPAGALLLLLPPPRGGEGRGSFPRDVEAISLVEASYTARHPVFVGGPAPGVSTPEGGGAPPSLHLQLMAQVGRELLLGGRDHVYSLDLDARHGPEIGFSKRLVWRASVDEQRPCAWKGKRARDCFNYIKVLLLRPRSGEGQGATLFICGTNAFNPTCRDYELSSLQQRGVDVSGMAKCPYDPAHSNVALFADGHLYSGTVTDFLAIDAVLYRSLGNGTTLRSVKHDSRWLKEPHFVHVLEHGAHVFFFFRELGVEMGAHEPAVVSRVARVCRSDAGGSPRVLHRHWSSFAKASLACAVPGEPPFPFPELHALVGLQPAGGPHLLVGVFTTPANSITGSAVCAFHMEEVARVFSGRFKEPRSGDHGWTTVPEEKLPTPRPGCCVGDPCARGFHSSAEFPEETLQFVKSHPLLDETVGSLGSHPWLIRSIDRWRLTHVAVDTSAGPYGNETVLFVGSEGGHVIKALPPLELEGSAVVLEQLEAFNPRVCGESGGARIVALSVDAASHALLVAFSSCLVRLPLSRCERHATCRRACVAARDPYCGWVRGSCQRLDPRAREPFEQDVAYGDTSGMEECADECITETGLIRERRVSGGLGEGPPPLRVPASLLVPCSLGAFLLGVALALPVASRHCRRRPSCQRPPPSRSRPWGERLRLWRRQGDGGGTPEDGPQGSPDEPRPDPGSPWTPPAAGPLRQLLLLGLPTPDATPEMRPKGVPGANPKRGQGPGAGVERGAPRARVEQGGGGGEGEGGCGEGGGGGGGCDDEEDEEGEEGERPVSPTGYSPRPRLRRVPCALITPIQRHGGDPSPGLDLDPNTDPNLYSDPNPDLCSNHDPNLDPDPTIAPDSNSSFHPKSDHIHSPPNQSPPKPKPRTRLLHSHSTTQTPMLDSDPRGDP
ncbi:semaphorin-6B-like [Lampetra fluviatilis]